MVSRSTPRAPEDIEQRRTAVERTDVCLCVEAGAGTGKTTLLVDRIVRLITGDGARLRDIAAITFTEKAAGELKVRLYEKLDGMLEESPPPGEEEVLRRALEDLEVCQVSTIHSFAGNLIRIRPVEAGVDPGFTVVDENEVGLITSEAWRRWLTENLAGEDPVIELAEGLGVTYEKLGELAGMFHANRDVLSGQPAHEPDFAAVKEVLAGAEAGLGAAVSRLERILRSVTSLPGDATLSDLVAAYADYRDTAVKGILELLGSLDACRRSGNPADLAAALVAAAGQKPTASRNWPGDKDSNSLQKEVRLELKAFAEEAVSSLGTLLAPGIVARVLSYIEMVEEQKERLGVLDFQDLLLKARDMLRDNLEARAYFQEQYSHILVDEFQDTDPLQAEIVFFLAEDGARAREWREVALKHGKLFIVGDPKQSIYRFRRADIEVYDRARGVMGEASTVTVWQNFRSVRSIIDWVNTIFSRLMLPPESDAYQAQYRDIGCYFEEFSAPAVTIAHNREFVKEPAGAARELEAEYIAESIEEMLERGERVRGRDGEWREASYGDICLLFRIGTNIGIYERVLREHGIPFRSEGGRTFFGKQEVIDLRNAACAVDNPYDEVAVVGALKSPFFAVSDSELAEYRASGGRFNYLARRAGGGRISDALAALASLHARRNARPLSATLESLLEETGACELYAVTDDYGQALANFTKVIEWARGMEQKEGASFAALAAWLTEMGGRSVQEGESPVEEAGGDFVRIMSVHRAKGLEFPVVFVAGIGKPPNPKNVRLIVRHAEGRAAFQIGQVKSEGFEALAEWDQASESAEERRVFYVCTTRAKDRLIINDFSAKGSGTWFNSMLDEVRDACGAVEESVDLGALEPPESPPREPPAGEAAGAADIAGIERDWEKGRESAFARGLDGPRSRSATEAEMGPLPPAEPYWRDLTGGGGVGVGNAFHRLMESLEPGRDCPDLSTLAREAALEHGVEGSEEQLIHMAGNVISSDLWKRAARAETRLREMPFTVAREWGYMNGYIDLLLVEDDGVVVVDYKSDNVAAAGATGRLEFYRGQGEFYREALEAAGVGVKEVVFFFAAPGVALSL